MVTGTLIFTGCIEQKVKPKPPKKIVEKKTIDENIIIQSQREPFTPIEFREYMKELDAKLFIDLDSKLFRGKDWVEYKQVQNTLVQKRNGLVKMFP